MDERLNMSNDDVDRLRVIRDVLDGKVKWREASQILGLSERQVARLCAKVRKEGNLGVLHGLLGRSSNHQLDPELLSKALSMLHDPLWHDFGPTFAKEHLEKPYDIVLSVWTVRKLMIWSGLWNPRRRRARHRKWRERRQCVGMLVQLDGSDHDWFEGRGARCVLILYIDDATGRLLYGEFVNVEDTMTLLRTARAYLRKYGRPVAFYVDRDSIYKINRKATVEEELRGADPISQFTRAMGELGVKMIFANSPQAKGRVERSFRTHQDRLVKELRLRGISNMDEANRYLQGEYMPKHNRRYAVAPAEPVDVHKRLLPSHNLAAILCRQFTREVQNDFTVRYKSRFWQLERQQSVRIRPKIKLWLQERLDGSIHLVHKGRKLRAHQVPERPPSPSAALGRRKHRAPAPRPRKKSYKPTVPFYAGLPNATLAAITRSVIGNR